MARAEIKFAIEITKAGLINTPFKLSKIFIITLSIILLNPFGISNSDIGIYYLALMISVVAGSLAASIALMVIPASSRAETDLSSVGTRIALSLTSPIISALLVAPTFILSIIGTQYITGDTVLLILGISVLPFSITFNAISHFNNKGEHKKIIIIGFTELSIFLIAFYVLVTSYGIIGAALSVMLAFTAACIPSVIWLGKSSIRYIAISIAAITVGVLVGHLFRWIDGMQPIGQVTASFIVTAIIIVILKNISILELKDIINLIARKN